MFERMLAHPNVKLMLKSDFREIASAVQVRHIIYTGPVDEYFDYCYGRLPYRSLRFENETKEQEFLQPVMQVNYPNDYEFTRSVEIKHATGQKLLITTIVREYPEPHVPGREPYYPIPAPDTSALYNRYREIAEAEKAVSFVGRLATYRYYNMDQVIGMALTEYEKIAAKGV
jgi:UDP-galactopyranose mutase